MHLHHPTTHVKPSNTLAGHKLLERLSASDVPACFVCKQADYQCHLSKITCAKLDALAGKIQGGAAVARSGNKI